MSWLLVNYNKRSSKKYGWHPSWLDDHLTEFNSELIDCIKWFQLDHDLKADGMVGPVTFRRLLSSRDLQKSKNYIVVDGKKRLQLKDVNAFYKREKFLHISVSITMALSINMLILIMLRGTRAALTNIQLESIFPMHII